MSKRRSTNHEHRFPPQIISHAICVYTRFCLSFRGVEDLLAERGVEVSYETIRRWCLKFGPRYRRAFKRREGQLGDTWQVDEVFIRIGGQQHYLWRAVDQDGDVLDILVQRRRDARAAVRFFRKILAGQGEAPRRLVTDKLRSYPPAAESVLADAVHERPSTRTTELKCRINQLGSANGTCADSKRDIRHNDSLRFMLACRTCFDTVATYSGRRTIGCFATGRSLCGHR